jgi:hypothetical protein
VHLYLYEWWSSLLVTDAKANFQKMRAENRFWGLTDRKSFHPGSRCDAGEEPAPDLEDILTELITVPEALVAVAEKYHVVEPWSRGSTPVESEKVALPLALVVACTEPRYTSDVKQACRWERRRRRSTRTWQSGPESFAAACDTGMTAVLGLFATVRPPMSSRTLEPTGPVIKSVGEL